MSKTHEAFEADRWAREGWEADRSKHAAKLKGQASGLTTKRIETFQWAGSMVDELHRAYRELDLEPGERIGGTRLAKQLDAQGVLTRRGVRPVQLSDRGKAFADDLVENTDTTMIGKRGR